MNTHLQPPSPGLGANLQAGQVRTRTMPLRTPPRPTRTRELSPSTFPRLPDRMTLGPSHRVAVRFLHIPDFPTSLLHSHHPPHTPHSPLRQPPAGSLRPAGCMQLSTAVLAGAARQRHPLLPPAPGEGHSLCPSAGLPATSYWGSQVLLGWYLFLAALGSSLRVLGPGFAWSTCAEDPEMKS